MAKRIRKVDEFGPYTKMLVYGPNGSGKTRLIAGFPRSVVLDIKEEGTRSAVGLNARVFEAKTWDDIGSFYWYLASGKHPFKSVGIDTLSAMQNLAMAFVLDEKEARDPSAEKRMPDKRSYGRAGELVKGMILAFRDLEMNVIFTAQERSIKDDDTGEVLEYAVDLPAGSRGTATGSVAIVGYMQQREVRVRQKGKVKKVLKPVLTTRPSDQFRFLKDRTNNLGGVLVNPTAAKVLEAWANIDNNTED